MSAGRRTLMAAAACAALAILPPPAAVAARRDRPPDLQGPIADFWPRVKRDWARRITGLNRGPTQTAVWVAMIWDGPDEATLPIAEVAEGLQRRDALQWVRAQITRHRWSEIDHRDLKRMHALKQNVILLGTPEDNPLVERALAFTPIRVSRTGVTVAGRRVDAEGLLVVTIAPNPIDPRHYALVLTGTTPQAVAEASQAPFGGQDYLVIQGRRMVEQGMFQWTGGRPDPSRVLETRSFTPHVTWIERSSRRARLRHDPSSTSPARAQQAGRAIDAAIEEAARFYELPFDKLAPIDVWLYDSLEEKAAQTSDPRLAHMHLATGAIHLVIPREGDTLPSGALALAARRLLQISSGPWGHPSERELPGLAAALSLAWLEDFETIPLDDWAARSPRDPGVVPIELLFYRLPADPAQGDTSILDAASFTRRLALRHGSAALSRFAREARRGTQHDLFREIFGRSMGSAEAEWLEELKQRPVARAARRAPDDAPPHMQNPEAARLASAARQAFRSGRFEEAAALAARALAEPGGGRDDRAWAEVTLGRAHARSGRPAAATASLRSETIREGPETVRVLADYWLEILGRPLNGRAARDILMQDAETELLAFDWEKAEASLLAALAIDPASREAHAMLGQVYLSKYQYWYDRALLDLELFPGLSSADPLMYAWLADKGQEELRLASDLLPEIAPGSIAAQLPAQEPRVIVDETEASTHFLRGKAHYLRGELESARREMETVLELDRTRGALPAYARLYLARVAEARADLVEARFQLETILKMAPSGQVTKLAKEALRRLDSSLAPAGPDAP